MEIDRRIGARIKMVRKKSRLSQMELAERIGVSYQQIQKYEKGVGRISLFRLEQISLALDLPLTSLLTENGKIEATKTGEPEIEYHHASSPPLPLSREESSLLTLFRQLGNSRMRAGVLQQLQGLIELLGKKRPNSRPPLH